MLHAHCAPGAPRPRRLSLPAGLAATLLVATSFACGAGPKSDAAGDLTQCPQEACRVATARDPLGNCTYAARPDGSACEDNNPCTLYTTCTSGVCGGGTLSPENTPCDDKNACTKGEACHDGVCDGGARVLCPAATACRPATTCDPATGCADTTLAACVEGLADLPLTGCVDDGYVARVNFGGVGYAMLVDSGSSTTALAAVTCTNCSVAPKYPMAGRKTFGSIASQYSDGSGWNAATVYDVASAAPEATDGNWLMAFGAITAQQNNFFRASTCSGATAASAYQGILGLAPQSGASAGTTAFLDAAVTANALVYDAFAIGLCDRGGRIWLGGYDPASVAAPPVFTPMLSPSKAGNYYGIAIDDLALGADSLGQSSFALGAALVDSGTSGLYLPLQAYAALAAGLLGNPNFTALFGRNTLFARSASACAAPSQNLSPQQIDAALPPLRLTLPRVGSGETVTLSLSASQSYLTAAQQNTSAGTRYAYCTGAYPTARTTVLGAAALRGLVVVFDRSAGQVGFAAQVGCSATLPLLPPG